MLRAIPLLSVLVLLLSSPSQAALVSAAPAPLPPATSENASTAFLNDGSESRIGLLCHNDPVNRSDPFGLDAEFTLMRDPYVGGPDANPRLSAGIMSITENGKFMGSMRVNENGFQSGRQGIPAGNYVVLPKAQDGNFKAGTPAVTSPSMRDKPGATTAGHKEGDVLIHGEGKKGEPDSRACITCGPAGLKLATDVFNRNKDSTTMKVYNGPEVKRENEIPRALPLLERR